MDYDRVDELLAAKGISHRQLAEKIGVSTSTLLTWFAKRPQSIKQQHVEAIAEVLGVSYLTISGNLKHVKPEDFHEIESALDSVMSAVNKETLGYSNRELLAAFNSLSFPAKKHMIDELSMCLIDDGVYEERITPEEAKQLAQAYQHAIDRLSKYIESGNADASGT